MHRVALDDLGVESGDRGVDRDGGLDLNTQVVYMIEIPEEYSRSSHELIRNVQCGYRERVRFHREPLKGIECAHEMYLKN